MTFMKGTTTWAALQEKLVQLATGAVADDYGVTASETDKWRRIDPAYPVIVPPAGTDVIVSQEHRAGYWLRLDDTCMYADRVAGAGTFVRNTGIITGTWTAAMRVLATVTLKVTTANTVAGVYSNAVVQVKQQAIDSASGALAAVTSPAIAADGSFTATISPGVTMTLQVGDASGILALNAVFQRTFTDAYRGGIDTWRGYGKATTSPTFSVAPPGTTVTDYAPVSLSPDNSLLLSATANWWFPGVLSATLAVAHSRGLGIKTAAALTGARYVVGFSKNEAMGAVLYNATTAAASLRVCWAPGGYAVNSDATVQYGVEGSNQFHGAQNAIKAPTFLAPFSSIPASTAAKVEYWVSVTPQHFTVCLNGESTYGGQESQNMVAQLVKAESTGDPVWFLGQITPTGNLTAGFQERHWIRLGVHGLSQRMFEKGFRDGGRDWQTGSGRYDLLGFSTVQAQCYFGEQLGVWANTTAPMESMGTSTSTYQGAIAADTNRLTVFQYADPRWLMMATPLLDTHTTANSDATIPGGSRPAGYVDHGLLLVGLSGFASGDELTDTVTGKKYMLFIGTNRSGIGGQGFGIAMEEV